MPDAGDDPATPEDVYTGMVKAHLARWQGWAKAARAKLDKLLQPAA